MKKRQISYEKCLFFWSKWWDLNPRPLAPETSTLPTALHLDIKFFVWLSILEIIGFFTENDNTTYYDMLINYSGLIISKI